MSCNPCDLSGIFDSQVSPCIVHWVVLILQSVVANVHAFK